MGVHLSHEIWKKLESEYRGGSSAKTLARKYGVSPLTIFARSSRKKWRDSPIRAAEPTQVERLERLAARFEATAQLLTRGAK